MTMKIMGGPAKEILGEIEMDEKENFTPAQIERFKNDPEFYRRFVKDFAKEARPLNDLTKKDVPFA